MNIKKLSFIKENDIWYADLPEFLEAGLGTKANLMMVDGADTFLDILSKNGDSITLNISDEVFDGYQSSMKKIKKGLNAQLLELVGHAKVDYGAYYNVLEHNNQSFNHKLWLCPVTEYVFGYYPDNIYVSIIKLQS
jgi:hypothetical protein